MPALDEVSSESVIAAKVNKSLQLSLAQELFWQRPITPLQLQAEIERMAQQSTQPEMLGELWQALDNDPFLVAECLALPLLAERLAHSRFEYDNRIHGDVRRQAEQEFAWLAESGTHSTVSGSYREVELRRGTADDEDPNSGVVMLSPGGWQAEIERLAAAFREAPVPDLPVPSTDGSASLPIGRFSPLREERDRFSSLAILEQRDGLLRLALVSWPKESFDHWWLDGSRPDSRKPQRINRRRRHKPGRLPVAGHTRSHCRPVGSRRPWAHRTVVPTTPPSGRAPR